jgi:hypothetical protein
MPTPEWTDKIPSKWICEFYHIFFIINVIIATLSLIGVIFMFAISKKSIIDLSLHIFQVVLVSGLAATQALFFYLMCDRALKPDGSDKVAEADRPFI